MKRLILTPGEATLFPAPDQPDSEAEGEAQTREPDLEIIARIPVLPSEEASPWLPILNYQPDQAIRQATLARVEQWQEEDARLSYRGSHGLLVELRNKKHPLPGEEARATIRRFCTSTWVTAPTVQDLWHPRGPASPL